MPAPRRETENTDPIDRDTAIRVLVKCSSAFESLNEILLDRSPDLSDAAFLKLRHSVGDVLAYIVDLLMAPAIADHPDLNPFDTNTGQTEP